MMWVRFPLSPRYVEDLLFEHRIENRHETICVWWNRFCTMLAGDIRRQRPGAEKRRGSAQIVTRCPSRRTPSRCPLALHRPSVRLAHDDFQIGTSREEVGESRH